MARSKMQPMILVANLWFIIEASEREIAKWKANLFKLRFDFEVSDAQKWY